MSDKNDHYSIELRSVVIVIKDAQTTITVAGDFHLPTRESEGGDASFQDNFVLLIDDGVPYEGCGMGGRATGGSFNMEITGIKVPPGERTFRVSDGINSGPGATATKSNSIAVLIPDY